MTLLTFCTRLILFLENPKKEHKPFSHCLFCCFIVEGIRKLFSGATMASTRGALVSVGQVKPLCFFAIRSQNAVVLLCCMRVRFVPAAVLLRPVQTVGPGYWLPDGQHPHSLPGQCVCGK